MELEEQVEDDGSDDSVEEDELKVKVVGSGGKHEVEESSDEEGAGLKDTKMDEC